MSVPEISRPFVGLQRHQHRSQRIATWLYHKTRQCQDRAPPTENLVDGSSVTIFACPNDSPITMVCVSDTHNTFPEQLPPGDILVHAGDLSQFGTFAEIQAQLTWLSAQPHQHKVVIAGNHDLLLDSEFVAAHPDRELDQVDGKRRQDLNWGDIHYLKHEAVELAVNGKDRSLRIFGSPWTPRFGNWAFQYESTSGSSSVSASMNWNGAVPPGTDVLIVHGPPKGHLDDGGKGCEQLMEEIWRSRPKVVVCGHIHAGRGVKRLWFDGAQSMYEAAVQGRGQQWLVVLRLALYWGWALLRRLLAPGGNEMPIMPSSTLLVNAAVVGGRGYTEHYHATIVGGL
ncbi:hypothetical protein MCOR25_004948 [Pyricularia grisea]|nr:hypothetical protein MCOR25_004948 [Pyricularia grisea]